MHAEECACWEQLKLGRGCTAEKMQLPATRHSEDSPSASNTIPSFQARLRNLLRCNVRERYASATQTQAAGACPAPKLPGLRVAAAQPIPHPAKTRGFGMVSRKWYEDCLSKERADDTFLYTYFHTRKFVRILETVKCLTWAPHCESSLCQSEASQVQGQVAAACIAACNQ